MKHTEVRTTRQLSNYLRCEEEYLTSFLSGYLFIYDCKSRSVERVKVSMNSVQGKSSADLARLYIPKKNKNLGFRVVYKVRSEAFLNILKILTTYLSGIYQPNKSVHGFVVNRNIRTNACQHLAKKNLLSIDIKDYFETISLKMINESFIQLGFTNNIAEILSIITTINGKLCQGYNTSPIIANIVSQKLDDEFLNYCGKNITYTRYADDLYFSSNDTLPSISDLEKIVNKQGFKLNPLKNKFMKRGSKQYVTGLSVFDQYYPRIPRTIKRNLRLEIYYLKKYGFISHACKQLNYKSDEYKNSIEVKRDVSMFLESLTHRISGWLFFMYSIEPIVTSKLYKEYQHALKLEEARYQKDKNTDNHTRTIKLDDF